jgi:hypothetical protein
MAVRIDPKKPLFELLPFLTANNPSKNYVFNLLYRVIQEANPARTLDAGTGELRNRWMVPGTYLGITIHAAEILKGIARNKKAPIHQTGATEVYVMRLENDLSFFSPVDISLCSYTIGYVADRAHVLRHLAGVVRQGGSLFLQDEVAALDTALSLMDPLFEDIQVVYTAYEGLYMPDYNGSKTEVLDLTKMEMRAPNRAEGHEHFCLIAKGKKTPAVPAGARPDITEADGLFYVTKDQDWINAKVKSGAGAEQS